MKDILTNYTKEQNKENGRIGDIIKIIALIAALAFDVGYIIHIFKKPYIYIWRD